MSSSLEIQRVFEDVPMAEPIEVFKLTKLYNTCLKDPKVNLGVGAYRDENGKPWVLPVVKEAEMAMAKDMSLDHEYLPVSGLSDFCESASKILLGSQHPAITDNRVKSFQSLGGTGALRLAAAFLKNVLSYDTVYVSNPTWGNHKGVFRGAGFTHIKEYRYFNSTTFDLDLAGLLEDLSNATEKSVVILHAVAHNPTGVDPSEKQWEEIYKKCKEKRLFVLMDCAYQGFASGDLDIDGLATRYFASEDNDMFIAQSFSKNFGLYNERVGNLIVVSKDAATLPFISSQMEMQIRIMWSNPPNHGARIVSTVLKNKSYLEAWKVCIHTMADRIMSMRKELFNHLTELNTPGTWGHIIKQIGMFSYTGLTPKQVEMMQSQFNVFLLKSGRISMCGITSKNVEYVAKAIDAAVRAYPSN